MWVDCVLMDGGTESRTVCHSVHALKLIQIDVLTLTATVFPPFNILSVSSDVKH